jgi:sodium/hydrogen exchanger 10/11
LERYGAAAFLDQCCKTDSHVAFAAAIDPHILLYIFLPALIYEGTAAVDFHIFRKEVYQMLLLAGPGVLLATMVTAFISQLAFTEYDWDWSTWLTFGAMLSATDPVAVVALMKDMGAPKQLGILIEGESLFNDGTAMAIFIICMKSMEDPETAPSTGESVLIFLRLALGGALLGLICGKALIWCLGKMVENAVSEITVTIAACYGSFFIAESSIVRVSGVLAVLGTGLVVAQSKTAISPAVEEHMHQVHVGTTTSGF